MRFDRSTLVARVALLACGALALPLGACTSSKSFVVLTLESDGPGVVIPGVVQIVVTVSQTSVLKKTLIYPAPGIMIDRVRKNDLSVSFTGGQSGVVTLDVSALDARGCTVGHDVTTAVLRRGSIATATASLQAENDCSKADGGAPGQDGATFPGCDPVAPVCAAGQTCQVNCMSKMGECTKGGNGPPGSACTTNADCAPGSQCFDYSGTGCNVKLCLRFCNDETQCAPRTTSDGGASDAGASDAGDGGPSEGGADDGGPAVAAPETRSLCLGPVQCGTVVTSYHTCTFACDPRETAVREKTSGCAAGLSCLVVGDMDQVDCACAEKTRVGTDGADCTSGAQCAPGYVCNLMGAVQKCRAVCRCDAVGMDCSAPNNCAAAGKSCKALTNDTIFGVCL